MASTDTVFSGSIPAIYDRLLGPFLFEPYGQDMAARLEALAPQDILETAAGTGVVTAAIVERLPEATVIATDLNQAMLDVAAARIASPRVEFRQVDAQRLPFPDGAFDAVVTQFGVMFYPDRIGAYREALRVLRPGGVFLFNVWGRLEDNPVTAAIVEAVAGLFPANPPDFLRRTPHGYHDVAKVEQDLRAAGFSRITAETVTFDMVLASPRDPAEGLCLGSPMRSEIEARGGDPQVAAKVAAAAVARLAGPGGLVGRISAEVFSARA